MLFPVLAILWLLIVCGVHTMATSLLSCYVNRVQHVRDPHGSFTYSLAALVQQMRYIKSAVQLIYKLKYETGDAQGLCDYTNEEGEHGYWRELSQ